MEKLEIFSNEILQLASYFDKLYFYGLNDPYFGMTPEEIKLNKEDAKIQLDKKGYISFNFDGSLSVTKKGEELIERTLKAKVYMIIDGLIDGVPNKRIIYYKSDSIETYCELIDNLLIVEDKKIDYLNEEIERLYLFNNIYSTKCDKSFVCKINILAEIKKQIDNLKSDFDIDSIKDKCSYFLTKDGCDKLVAEGIVLGILNNCNTLSFAIGNTKERNFTSYQLIVLNDRIVLIEILNNDNNEMKLKLIDKNDLFQLLDKTISNMEES